MIGILKSHQIRECEQATFASVSPIKIIENVGELVVEFIENELPEISKGKIVVLCGKGNNGADAYSVASVLASKNLNVFCIDIFDKPSTKENSHFRSKLDKEVGSISKLSELSLDGLGEMLHDSALIIDGIFGISGTAIKDDDIGTLVTYLNDLCSDLLIPILSLDLPSGIICDSLELPEVYVHASMTLTFQHAKYCMLSPEVYVALGCLTTCNVGLKDAEAPEFTMISTSFVNELKGTPDPLAHKGSKGQVLVLGGNIGSLGAAMLAGRAAFRSGAGLVTLLLPDRLLELASPHLYEMMGSSRTIPRATIDTLDIPSRRSKSSLIIGPGLQVTDESRTLVRDYLEIAARRNVPTVIDADGLTLLAGMTDIKLPQICCLTPHIGEMAKLLGVANHEIERDRLLAVRACAKKYNTNVLLKGPLSLISTPDGVIYLNTTCTSSLATAGSGDVLSGIVGSFLANGLDSLSALICAVYFHGKAGMELEDTLGDGTMATDLIEILPEVMLAS